MKYRKEFIVGLIAAGIIVAFWYLTVGVGAQTPTKRELAYHVASDEPELFVNVAGAVINDAHTAGWITFNQRNTMLNEILDRALAQSTRFKEAVANEHAFEQMIAVWGISDASTVEEIRTLLWPGE